MPERVSAWVVTFELIQSPCLPETPQRSFITHSGSLSEPLFPPLPLPVPYPRCTVASSIPTSPFAVSERPRTPSFAGSHLDYSRTSLGLEAREALVRKPEAQNDRGFAGGHRNGNESSPRSSLAEQFLVLGRRTTKQTTNVSRKRGSPLARERCFSERSKL